MEIRVIKTPSSAVTIPNLNLPMLKLRQAGAAFAAGSRRSLRLNRRFNYQNILLFKTKLIYSRKVYSNLQ